MNFGNNVDLYFGRSVSAKVGRRNNGGLDSYIDYEVGSGDGE